MMFNPNSRPKIRELMRRPLSEYKSDVYINGKIRFNFQVNTTVDIEHPFKAEDINYEETLANYFVGLEADVSTNGGGLVIVRGATGAGKSTSINRAIMLAKKKLYSISKTAKLDPIFLQFNNISSIVNDDNINEAIQYVWREFASEITRHLGQKHNNPDEDFNFVHWLNGNNTIKNQITNIFRFFEKNESYINGIKTGKGYARYSVNELKEIVMTDWRSSFSSFTDSEIAKYKIAKLRYQIETNNDDATHRVIIIDNVDHLPPQFQQVIVDSSIWLSEFLGVRLLIAVRPLTWENQHGHKSLEVEEHLGPSLADVLCKRLNHITEHDEIEYEAYNSIRWLINELRDERSHLRKIIYGASGMSVRALLRNFSNFLSSPILDNQNERIRPSEVARAFFFGSEQSMDHDNVEGLYSVGHIRMARVSLLKPRIIDFILRSQGGRSSVVEVFEFSSSFGFSENEISKAIDELILRKRSLIWSNSFDRLGKRSKIKDTSILSISPMGASYFSSLFGEYLYSECCLASSRKQSVSPVDVVEFSRALIIEDEDQIDQFLSSRSSADYYSVYGIEFPSISYGYWRKFVLGASARQSHSHDQAFLDTGWESRIRGFLQGKTGKNYLAAQR